MRRAKRGRSLQRLPSAAGRCQILRTPEVKASLSSSLVHLGCAELDGSGACAAPPHGHRPQSPMLVEVGDMDHRRAVLFETDADADEQSVSKQT